MAFSNGKANLKLDKKTGDLRNSTGTCRVEKNGTQGWSYRQLIVKADEDLKVIFINSRKFSVTTSGHTHYLINAIEKKFPNFKKVSLEVSDMKDFFYFMDVKYLCDISISEETLKTLKKAGFDENAILKRLELNNEKHRDELKADSINKRMEKLLKLEYKNSLKMLNKLKDDYVKLYKSGGGFSTRLNNKWQLIKSIQELPLDEYFKNAEFLTALNELLNNEAIKEKLNKVNAVLTLNEVGS